MSDAPSDGGHHEHDPFRDGEDIDWARLAARQRDRIPLADAWWDLLGRPVGRRLADVGCGPGALAAHYAELGADVLGVDLRPDALRHVPTHPRLRTLAHDLEAAPLPAPVDVLVLSDVLHHARAPARMLEHARASSTTILVAEWDPAAPAHAGPPREMRLAPDAVSRMLSRARFAPHPTADTAFEHYAIVATAAGTERAR